MNLKKYYKDLLFDNSLIEILGSQNKIVSAYPQEVKIFPLVVYEDSNSRDIEFSDNLPNGTSASVRVHIFTKTLAEYPTTTEIAEIVKSIFRNDFWSNTLNQETSDVQDNVRHRILDFTKEFYSL